MALNSPLWAHAPFSEATDFSAVSNTGSETSVLGGVNRQPRIPPDFFDSVASAGRRLRLRCSGVLSTTGTPTIIFQVRSSTTVGSGTLSGASVGVSPTITTGSGVTNVKWDLELDITGKTIGQGTNNCTLSCQGKVYCPTGFASPFFYPLQPTTPPSATWTATIDATLEQFLNVSITWGTPSSSNTLTCKDIDFFSEN